MAKISENRIPDINADWGLDTENGLPYSGEAVQEFIKDTFKSKFGYFHYDENNNRYLVFADEASKNLYVKDSDAYKDLLLTTFDAPFNYSMNVQLISEAYNAVLIGTKGLNLQFKFAVEDKSGNNTGENVDCTINVVNKGVKQTISKLFDAQQGREGVLIELDGYLTEGTNNIMITLKGQNSLAASTISVVYQIINLKLTDNFNISNTYNNGDILEVSCVVEGAGNKVLEWYLDGEQLPFELIDEIVYTTAYSVNKNILLEALEPGVHSIQYRLRSQVGSDIFYSQTLFRNFFVKGVEETLVGIATELPIGVEPVNSNVLDTLYGMIQYVPYNIRYAIYNPNDSATNIVSITVNSEPQVTTNITNGVENTASIVSNDFGNLPIQITVNGVSYNMNANVEVSSIGIAEIADAKLNLRAFGRDNDSLDYESWTYGDYSTTFEGFYWNVQSGWVDNTLIINTGASVDINYIPFANDPMETGKTIEIEFATRNVVDNDGEILNLVNDNGHGLLITASEAKLTTSDNKTISTKFKAEETNRISFVINRRDVGNNAGFVFIYVNGILCGAAECDETATIRVNKNIVFKGSSDILLKQILIYDKPLSSDEILNNYILYRDSISEMLSIYNRNNVTAEDGQLSPEKLVNMLPVMYFTGLDENRGIPFLETQSGKAATKIDTYFDIEYQNAQDKTKNFKLEYARVRIQGTSSSYYPRKNYRFYSNKEDESILYDWQGNIVPDRQYSFKDGAQPVDCWCLKTDYAESSGSHNTGVARLWNDVMKKAQIEKENKLMTTAQKVAAESGYPYDVRTTVDGFPIVVFYRNSYNHPWQFLGKFNFNNDKSTPSVFGFCDIPGFDNSKMQCWEVLNNGHALCNFTKFDSDYFDENWADAFEARYDEDNPLIEDLKAFSAWIYSTKDDLEKFKTEKWDHLDVYKMAAYYVYIMRFGAVDQTVKNSMFTSEDGEHFFFINYDNDTIFGVRNDGLLKHGPYIDRQSIDPEKEGTENPYVYAGHDSVLWNNLEADEEFMEIVKIVDSALHDAGLTYDSVIDMFENEQTAKWCEKVCNIDAHYKYIAPEGRVIESLQGTRDSHRRWWVSERFNLYDAKFVTGDFKNYIVELKVAGTPEQHPFAKITAAKRQPYGYEILNSVSEVTDVLNIGDTYEFKTPANQTLQEGDPISIYSACNIEELDLSGSIPYALKVDLSRTVSTSIGTSLKRLIMNGNNNALTDTTFVGTELLTRLEYLDIQGLSKLGSINLSNSLNLHTLLAKNSGLTSVNLTPGCLIERLELPTSIAAVVLKDLPLLTAENLVLDGDWCNVRMIEIAGCPNLTNDFNLIWNWYKNTSNIDARSLNLEDVNWTDVDLDKLIELGNNVNIRLKGRIKLAHVDDKQKLLTLKVLFGDNIFNKESDLYIYGPNAIYVFGPESILEGESAKFETIIFSTEEGTQVFVTTNGEREGVTLDRSTGELTTIENGLPSVEFTVRAGYVLGSTQLINDSNILVEKRTYPEAIYIDGPNRISESVTTFTWGSPTVGINGEYAADWTLTGDILNYAAITKETYKECVITRNSIPENLATGILSINLYRKVDNSLIASVSLNVNIVNPDVIMTSETNPEVLKIFYNIGKTESSEYMLKSEAEAITNSDLTTSTYKGLFTSTNITHFEEFQYFTGITEIPSYCFQNTKLNSIVLPKTIKSIGNQAFGSTSLTSIELYENVNYIHEDAFAYSNSLTNISVKDNLIYYSYEGCVYRDYLDKLCILAPGLTEYVMPEETTSIYGSPEGVLKNGRMLRKLVINTNITDITGKWFLYGYKSLTEVTFSGERNDGYVSYNGCIYNGSELAYYPSGKVYDESELLEGISSFGKYAFTQHKSLEELIVPNNITSIGEWCFTYTAMKKITVPEGCSLKENAISWNNDLNEIVINSSNLDGSYICYSNSALTTVSIPNGVINLPNYMFGDCKKLNSINLPESLLTIGLGVFQNCETLAEITIPSSVTSIGSGCFKGCYLLADITSLPISAPSIGENIFGIEEDSTGNGGYVGKNAIGEKNFYITTNASGYDNWITILQDKAGFTINKTL